MRIAIAASWCVAGVYFVVGGMLIGCVGFGTLLRGEQYLDGAKSLIVSSVSVTLGGIMWRYGRPR